MNILKYLGLLFFILQFAFTAKAEIQIIDGVKYECKDGMCMPIEDDEPVVQTAAEPAVEMPVPSAIAQGYMKPDALVAFLNGDEPAATWLTAEWGTGIWITLFLILLGGLLMNLTPCVLPMVPINLMVIGKSAVRGAWYGLGIALAYGTMGVLAAVGGMAFGEIQSSPWFNAAIAVLFTLLALALAGVFFIDLSKGRAGAARRKQSMLPWLFAFFMGIVSAVLAGACVAPILISVLLMTAKLYAEGNVLALALPFVLGLGMALPWPFLGAGLQVLPKPGAWMKWVNRLFALLVFGFAVWYGALAVRGFTRSDTADASSVASDGCTPATFAARLTEAKRPVFVDCGASWCKNCAAMEREVFPDARVKEALAPFTVIRLQSEDIRELKALPGLGEIRGLPAFLIYR